MKIKNIEDVPWLLAIIFYATIGIAALIVFSGCTSMTSVKECGMVVDVYTKEQIDDRWECKSYTWWDKFWRGF